MREDEPRISGGLDTPLKTFAETTHMGGTITYEVAARLPIEEGKFHLHLFKDRKGKEHLALVMGDVKRKDDVLCRVHSECLTGDLFGSLRCDCGPQLRESIERISEEELGILIYLRQEGRGIGLVSKLKAYNLQDEGFDTVDANIVLGHKAEERDYGTAAHILSELDVRSIRLLSNNPDKIRKLRDHGIMISGRVPMHPRINSENERYLRTKVDRMEHEIDLSTLSENAPEREDVLRFVQRSMENIRSGNPKVTLYMVQGLDGRIPVRGPGPYTNNKGEEILLRHQLRELHEGFIIDAASLLDYDMDLRIAHENGGRSRPIVIDPVLSTIRRRPDLMAGRDPVIICRDDIEIPEDMPEGVMVLTARIEGGTPDIRDLMDELRELSVETVMIEGPPTLITSMIRDRTADTMVSTMVPYFFDEGACAMEGLGQNGTGSVFSLKHLKFKQIGNHMVYYGRPDWRDEGENSLR
ncbi:MAG: GTP cyclohydrolase II [Thermoplasmatota archaeon]